MVRVGAAGRVAMEVARWGVAMEVETAGEATEWETVGEATEVETVGVATEVETVGGAVATAGKARMVAGAWLETVSASCGRRPRVPAPHLRHHL